MERTHCHYHSVQPATWHCQPCQRPYGDCCAPQNADVPESIPACALCRAPLTFLGAANTAEPFWERLPSFFLYGLQGGPLAFCALLAVVSLFMPPSLLLWLGFLAVSFKYFQTVIELTSAGTREAPSLVTAYTDGDYDVFLKLLVIFAVAFGVLWLATDFNSEAMYWAATIGIQLLMPASIICLALDKELGQALNPERVWQVIKAIGWRYLILCAFLFILWQSPSYVSYILSHGLPRVVLMPIASGMVGYFSVVMCALIGYAVFQYQGALGYAAVADDVPRGFAEPEWRRRKALADAEVRLKEGQSDSALEVLAVALERAPDDLKLNERFHQLLYGLSARERCLRHLDHYLPLAARLNPAQAAIALLNARQLKADYLPADPQVCEKVASALMDRHKIREGLSLLRNLHQRHPEYPFIARAYLLAARGFSEGLGQLDPARQLLTYIRQRSPATAQQEEFIALEATINKLASVSKAKVPDFAMQPAEVEQKK